VRVNDSDHVLGAAPTATSVAPRILMGVMTRHRTFEPVVPTGKDANGSDHQVTVPAGEMPPLQVVGQGVSITDSNGAALNSKGASLPVNAKGAAAPDVITINVHSSAK
jgi:hypothetical protein